MIKTFVDGVKTLITNGLTYLEKVDDLPGQASLDANLDLLMRLTPAVYVIYEGGAAGDEKYMPSRQEMKPGVMLAVIAKNFRDTEGRAALRGDDATTGAYEILDDLRTALLGKIPAANFSPLFMGPERLYRVVGGKVVYLASYKSKIQIMGQT